MAEADCVFCEVLAGREDGVFVYREERVSAFLDRAPVNPGHTLVVPNHHVGSLEELELETGGRLFQVGMRVAQALRASALHPEGINMWLADGEAAFQEVFHLHLHVFPRYRGDGFSINRRSWLPVPRERLESAAVQLRAALGVEAAERG